MTNAVVVLGTDVAEAQLPVRPPLKWAGGKCWQVPHIKAFWKANSQRRLVEPFCGGLAVTLGLMPDKALLNDVNPHLINFYLWLKRSLITALPFENGEAAYYSTRTRFNQLLADGKGETARALPLQHERRVQRAFRPLQADPLPPRLHRVQAGARGLGL